MPVQDSPKSLLSASTGCSANACRNGGSYNGSYSFTTFVGSPQGCNDKYCEYYLPGGIFASRCTAAAGSYAKGYADAECAATCAGTCPAGSTVAAPSGCESNKCRPTGGYTGYYSFTTFVGNPVGCTPEYCENYLPGGLLASRCTAAAGSVAKGFADAECAATCAGTCAVATTSSSCDQAALKRYNEAIAGASLAEERAGAKEALADRAATKLEKAAAAAENAAAKMEQAAIVAEAALAAGHSDAHIAAALAAERACDAAETAAATAAAAAGAADNTASTASAEAEAARKRAAAAKKRADDLEAGIYGC